MVQEHCLNEETLANYLEGSLDAPMRTAAEQHLVSCDACRSRLVCFMRVLEEDVREDEESVLEAAMARWGEGAAQVPSRRRAASAKWAVLAAAILAAVTLGVFLRGFPGGSGIVETAASRERPFEARLDAQVYLDFVATRDGLIGPGRPDYRQWVDELMRDGSLYEAGVISLYDRDFDQAIILLTAAIRENGQVPERRNDLGVAYLEKAPGSADEEARNRAVALEQFQAALSLDSEYATAIYNLALFYEREAYAADGPEQERLYAAARAQQDRYLELDPSSQWADEVREARSALERTLGGSLPSSN